MAHPQRLGDGQGCGGSRRSALNPAAKLRINNLWSEPPSRKDLMMTTRHALAGMLGCAAMVLMTLPLGAADKVRIIQTNSAGDRVSLIDPLTNKVVGEIKDIEANHGA